MKRRKVAMRTIKTKDMRFKIVIREYEDGTFDSFLFLSQKRNEPLKFVRYVEAPST